MLYNLAYKLRTDRQKGTHYSHRVLSILCMWTLTGPLMVPEASRSPGLTLQPLTVWWASCCFMVQYMYLSQRDRNKNKTLVNSRRGQSWYAAAQHAFLLCTLFCLFLCLFTAASCNTLSLSVVRHQPQPEPGLYFRFDRHYPTWDCETPSALWYIVRNRQPRERKQKWGWRTDYHIQLSK